MKKLVCTLLMLLAVSGCSTAKHLGETAFPNPRTYGYTSYDPCIRCGEGWIFLNLDETKGLN
jgi:hypothetical protein